MSHDELVDHVQHTADRLGLDVVVRQTDSEAQWIGGLLEAAERRIPGVFNPAAWSHYNIAIADAVAQVEAPVIEVHLSNTARREEFRHHSVVSAYVTGTITGLGIAGYDLALRYLASGDAI